MVVRTSFKENTSISAWYTGNIQPGVSESVLVTPEDEDVCFIDAAAQEIVWRMEGDGEPVTAVTVSPDGKWAAIVSQSQQLRIVDIEEQEVVKSHRLSSPVYIAAADARSSLFAFGGADGVVTVWDIAGGYVTHSLKGHGTTVSSLSFNNGSAQNFLLGSGDIMGTIKVWDLVKRKAIHSLNEHTAAVRGLGFVNPEHADSSKYSMVSAGRDEVIILYSKSFKPAQVIPAKESVESCGFFEFDSDLCFYTAGNLNQLRVWRASSLKVVATTEQPVETSEELVMIDVVDLGHSLVSTISDQTIVYYDKDRLAPELTLAGNHGIIADCKTGPDSSLILATNAPAVRIVHRDRPLAVEFVAGHTDLLNQVDVNGEWMATASKDGSARVWKYENGQWIFHSSYSGHTGQVSAVALAVSKKFIITAGADYTIKKWAVAPGDHTTASYTRRAHDKEINAIAISANDAMLATASYDKTAKIWDVQSGETLGILKGHKRGLWDVSFSPSDPEVVTASGDKTAKIWSVTSFTCTATLEGHTNSVQRAVWINSEQPQVVTSGADGLVKVWNRDEAVATLDGHDNRIWAVCTTDDEPQSIITGDADGKLVQWEDITDSSLLEKQEQERQRIEDVQKLEKLMGQNNWQDAFLLALTLGHSMRLYTVVEEIIASDNTEVLPTVISQLTDDQLVSVLKKIRDWNTNFRHFEPAQRLLAVVMESRSVEELHRVPQLVKMLQILVSYNERHYKRLDDMVEESFILDYCVGEMAK